MNRRSLPKRTRRVPLLTQPSKLIEGVHYTGPALVDFFTPGTRVVRGPDWKWGDQDGGASRQGTILADSEKSSNRQLLWYSNNIGLCNISGVGWLNVKWDNGQENSYRMGAQGCYDLQLLTGEEIIQKHIQKDINNSIKWPIPEKLSKALFTSPLPSHLECEICLGVLRNPLQTSCCGQSYCKDCISQIIQKVCPHCREHLEVFPDKKSIRFINELEVRCPYHIEDKCQWKGCSSELNKHIEICNYKPVLCSLGCGRQFEKKNEQLHRKWLCSSRKTPCQYCQQQVVEKDMVKHHKECPKIPIPCPNKCSTKEITREKMKDHIELCPDQVVRCKYSEFGCDRGGIKRKDHDQHLSSTMERHLYLVAEYAKKEKDARKLLEEKIEKKVAVEVVLERRIATLEKKLEEINDFMQTC